MIRKLRICTSLLLIAILLITMLPPKVVDIAITVEAAGTRLPSSSTTGISTISTDLEVPSTLREKVGTNSTLYSSIKKIYPTAKGNNLYWGRNLPFTLVDTKTGKEFPGYCAQSYAFASSNMQAKGIVTDPRIVNLINSINGDDNSTDSEAKQIAVQLALWGALNNNWSPDLFTKHMSLNENDYTGMKAVVGHLQRAAASWSDTISSGASKESYKPLKLESQDLKAYCHKTDKTKAIVEVRWGFLGGGKVTNIDEIADITYAGLTKVSGDDLAQYGVTKKANSHYLQVNVTGNGKGAQAVKATVKYKGKYKALNNATLVHYDGGSGNQPFIAPIEPDLEYEFNTKWDCPPDKEIPPPPPAIAQPASGSVSIIPLRWYNLVAGFGEIKNGTGYNPIGDTTAGGFTSEQSSEPFQVMDGVPSTERMYVNLGGTEGYIDVHYEHVTVNQPFFVQWNTPWYITYCGEFSCWTDSGTNSFSKTYNWEFKALHLKEASFRTIGDGNMRQSDLEYDVRIINGDKDPGSFSLSPNPNGLEIGPGVGKSEFNVGATNAWEPTQTGIATPTVAERYSVESDGFDFAHNIANAKVGAIFAQNDKLSITIKGTEYVIIPGENVKEAPKAFASPTPLDAAPDVNYFNPLGQKWDVWSKVPVTGYNGNPELGAGRNNGNNFKAENIPIGNLKGNGVYEFETDLSGNYVEYDTYGTSVKGDIKDLQEDTGGLLPQGGYASEQKPVDLESYKEGNNVFAHYTNWQAPVAGSGKATYNHSKKKPDKNFDKERQGIPSYMSLNPILIHTPVAIQGASIMDVPDTLLVDQRISGASTGIDKYGGALPRQYIDFDFTISIPNTANYSGVKPVDLAFDPDFTEPGTLGKTYDTSSWNLSKWINAKYVKFPYEVYYDATDNSGDGKGYYPAGQWIKLYDNGKLVDMNDPTDFTFHVSSGQKDVKNGIVYYVTEALNAPDGVAGNPDALYLSGQTGINSTRSKSGSGLGEYTTAKDGEALYSATHNLNVDLIGRIGNVLVSDSTDPAFTGVFWNTTSDGKIKVNESVQKSYGSYFNKYGITMGLGESSGYSPYDRHQTLTAWHGEMSPLKYLPVTTNTTTKGKNSQTMKLGYGVTGSVQTIGDHDYSMWIYPQNRLAGKYTTGAVTEQFKLFTTDPYMPKSKLQEYYSSELNNDTTNGLATIGRGYVPKYKHVVAMSLAETRLKLAPFEKGTTSYQKAVQLGASKKTILGTPSWLEITESTRTLMGKNESGGLLGASVNAQMTSSPSCECSFANVQKWNWKYSLPQNTKVIFNKNISNAKVEPAKSDQYIITSMIFRSKASRENFPGQDDEWQTSVQVAAITGGTENYTSPQVLVDWDLSTYTEKGSNNLPNSKPYSDPIPPNVNPGDLGTHSKPALDIVWWNYSKQSTTDKSTTGTH